MPAGPKESLKEAREKLTKALQRAEASLEKWRPPADYESPLPTPAAVSSMQAAASSREQTITLVFANDSGADGDFVTSIPERRSRWHIICSRQVASTILRRVQSRLIRRTRLCLKSLD